MSDEGRQPQKFRSVSLTLGLINVLQPVSRETLLEELETDVDEELTDTLRFLVSKGLVRRLPNNEYRTTWVGQRSLRPKLLAKSRDVQRMWYLADFSDRCRTGEEGEGS